MEKLVRPSLPVRDQRQLGRFYTPDDLASLLVRWGLNGAPGSVLDPSFGGCSFLRASLEALQAVGDDEPAEHVFGVDVDPSASEHARGLFVKGVPKKNLLISDFFSVSPDRSGFPRFDLVAGNPPYIRHHWLDDDLRDSAEAAIARQGVSLDGRANLWAYFLVHSSSFLRVGGRLAFILPSSVLFADFAEQAIRYIRARFRRSLLVEIDERVFEDTPEQVVLLLADGFGCGSGTLSLCEARSVAQLDRALSSDGGSARLGKTWTPGAIPSLVLNGELEAIWHRLVGGKAVRELRDVCRVRIGVVTGANSFFIRSVEAAAEAGFSRETEPIICRGSHLQGISWTLEDQKVVEDAGRPASLLIASPSRSLHGDLAAWVSSGEADQLHERSHCKRRTPWYVLDDGDRPDAFLRYMGKTPPKVVLNRAGCTSTNSIHRLWKKEESVSLEAVAVGSCTTLFALACETLGRRYGGGVLKIEPTAAGRLPIPVVNSTALHLDRVDKTLRNEGHRRARQLADRLVLREALGVGRDQLTILEDGLKKLAAKRYPSELEV